MRVDLLLLVGSLVVACASTTPPPSGPLGPADLEIAGLTQGASEQQVREALGSPGKVHLLRDPDYSFPIIEWHYRHLVVHFGEGAKVDYFSLEDPALSTARGVRVGDAISDVLARYPDPSYQDASTCVFLAENVEDLLGIQLYLKDGRVERIHVGQVAEY